MFAEVSFSIPICNGFYYFVALPRINVKAAFNEFLHVKSFYIFISF